LQLANWGNEYGGKGRRKKSSKQKLDFAVIPAQLNRHRHFPAYIFERDTDCAVTSSLVMPQGRKQLNTDKSDDEYQDPHPDQPIELGPHGRGVGRWVPDEKHLYLTQYLHATRKAQAKFKQRVLIDPFCGPGRIQVVGESFTRNGGSVAAYRQSVASGAPFTRVLIGDIEAERVRANQLRLAAAGATVQGFVGPATETVSTMQVGLDGGARQSALPRTRLYRA
jgi:hypothetical protein